MESDTLKSFLKEIENELTANILDYWMKHAVDSDNGGFVGQILHDNSVVKNANKGAVLNARILYSFSAAFNHYKNKIYLDFADRAFLYFKENFIDKEFGGVYWLLDYTGKPIDDKKQIYANAFAIYALTEYYVATSNDDALRLAKSIFVSIEHHSFDLHKNGYFEAYSRKWTLLGDLRLSNKDANEAKTMNTHLHLLEAYTSLSKIWTDELLQQQLENLLVIHIDKIVNKTTSHFNLFFDENWKLKSDIISFGHDIEGAWLMQEAALVVGNNDLIELSKQIAIEIAEITLQEGIQADGSLIYEAHGNGKVDTDRHWWVQAEAMVGMVNAYQNTYNEKYLQTALNSWQFIKQHIVSPTSEWYWSIYENYQPNLKEDKVGVWKCPYHNVRACLEVLKRLS